MPDISDFFIQADNAGLRLEIIGGIPTWRKKPNLTHQKAIDRIRKMWVRGDHLIRLAFFAPEK